MLILTLLCSFIKLLLLLKSNITILFSKPYPPICILRRLFIPRLFYSVSWLPLLSPAPDALIYLKASICLYFFLFLLFILILAGEYIHWFEREREREGERDWLPSVHALTKDQTHHLFGVWDNAPTSWATHGKYVPLYYSKK